MYELAALGAALCWALTGVLSTAPATAVGPFAFGLYRQGVVVAMLLVLVTLTGGWASLDRGEILPLALSGLVGSFLGDTFLYLALVRVGPRRAGALFALNAPMAALLGWIVLGERLSPQGWAGVALCSLGVATSVLGRAGSSHAYERLRGPVVVGAAFGVLAALGQASGSLLARPVMAGGGVDPMAASLVRMGVSFAALALTVALPLRAVRPQGPLTRRHALQTVLSGVIAMVIGMTLLLYALSGGKVGIVSTLSALSPVLVLPVLWGATGQRPSPTSWAGAAIAVLGMAMIFLR